MAQRKKTTKKEEQKKILKTKIIVYVCICALLSLSFIFQQPIEKWINYAYNPILSTEVTDSDLKVHFIDVGQGDSIMVELPDDKLMLIDAGTDKSKDTLISYIDANFFNNSLSEKIIDYFVMTHPHDDHIGGAIEIFNNYKILTTYRPKCHSKSEIISLPYGAGIGEYNSDIYDEVIQAMDNEDCTVIACTSSTPTIVGATYSIKFLTPYLANYDDVNNYSPIMILEYDGKKIMLTGDATTMGESEMIDACGGDTDLLAELDVDILKLGHHGSSGSTSNKMLNASKPEYIVISVGVNNKYKHPSKVSMARIEAYGITDNNIFRTDISGNIVFGVKDNGVGDGVISVNVNYTPNIPVHISLWYIYGVVVIGLFLIFFVSKSTRKKIKKLVDKK